MFTYAGAPAVNDGLKALRAVMNKKGLENQNLEEREKGI